MEAKTKCTNLTNLDSGFTPANEDPDDDCINCILDDILETPVGEIRDAYISLYQQGLMQLNCARTGKSYLINKGFFDKIFSNL